MPEARSEWFDFVHGTSIEHANAIRAAGLDEKKARSAKYGSARPGTFHVLPLDGESDLAALDLATHFGQRHAERPVLLIGRLPRSVFNGMLERGEVVVEPILGLAPEEPEQVVFSSDAYPEFNACVEWVQTLTPGRS